MNMNEKSKLTAIYLKNFQSIKEPTVVKLDKLTFFYGPNSAGKSSVIDAFSLLKKISSRASRRNDSDQFSISYHFRKNSGGTFSTDALVGVEYVSGMKHDKCQKEYEEWMRSPDENGDDYHQEFFSAINGKVVQLEFGEDGDRIGLAIDGQPLFEIETDYVYFDSLFKRCRSTDDDYDEREEELSDNIISGALTVYKKNPYYKYIAHRIEDFISQPYKKNDFAVFRLPQDSPYYKFVVEENSDAIKLHGINLSLDKRWQLGFVDVDSKIDSIFWPSEYEFDSLADSVREGDEEEFHDLMSYIQSDNQSSTPQRQRVYWALDRAAKFFNKLVQGLLLDLADVVQHSHVKGDRQLLNSKNAFYHDDLMVEGIQLSNAISNDMTGMGAYAEYLASDNSYAYPKPQADFDFVNYSLDKYLTSLRNYKVNCEYYEIKKPNDEYSRRTPVFLNLILRDSKKLGFEDVGSGLSYVFPILTSLWSSKFSFVEQPELHLHPSGQCELGDVFIAATKFGAISIVESHSEHLLLRVLRRIRETTMGYLLKDELKFSCDEMRIYYFQPQSDGFTKVKEIRVDKYGELLSSWPGGFFSEREKELFGERDIRG